MLTLRLELNYYSCFKRVERTKLAFQDSRLHTREHGCYWLNVLHGTKFREDPPEILAASLRVAAGCRRNLNLLWSGRSIARGGTCWNWSQPLKHKLKVEIKTIETQSFARNLALKFSQNLSPKSCQKPFESQTVLLVISGQNLNQWVWFPYVCSGYK